MSESRSGVGPFQPRPRGRNRGRYHGEVIEIVRVLREVREVAVGRGWQVDAFGAGTGLDLFALRRPGVGPGEKTRGVYLSAGIHADEPAGPLAVLELLHRDRWPANVSLWLCPCLNPAGFPLNQRENASGHDLNRDYRHLRTPEIRAHVAWLERQPDFDITVCLHEDWEASGFYLYELNADGRRSSAEAVVGAVGKVCPIDSAAVIDGRPARLGIIRPDLNPALRRDWPEAFYLVQHKTRHSFTLESPSDFALSVRVQALVVATEALVSEQVGERR